MAHRIERKVRRDSEQPITGIEIKKITDAVGTITHRVGQKGHNVIEIQVVIPDVFSPKEIRALAYTLMSKHRLRLRDIQVGPENRTTIRVQRVPKKRTRK